MERLRIGFIGAGDNTRRRHLPGFASLPGIEPAVVCNRSRESSQAVAAAFGIPRVAEAWRAVVADPAVDAICLGTWPYLHAEVTCAALAAGKHVLTEARMAADLREAEAMLAAAEARPDLVAQIVPSPFSLPFDATIQALLQAEALGSLRECRLVHLFDAAADSAAPLSWRMDRRLSGLNTMTLGIHYEMLQRWLGAPDPVSVRADAACFTPARQDPATGELRTVEIPETIDAVATYRDGFRSAYHVSAVHRGPARLELWLSGSHATLHYDLLQQTVALASGDAAMQAVHPTPGTAGEWQVEADFVASIREGKPVTLTSFRDGVRYMRFTQRVHESLANGGMTQAW